MMSAQDTDTVKRTVRGNEIGWLTLELSSLGASILPALVRDRA